MKEREFDLKQNLKDLYNISKINYMQLIIESIDPSTNEIAKQILKPIYMLYEEITYTHKNMNNAVIFLLISIVMPSLMLPSLYLLNIKGYILPITLISVLISLIGIVRLRYKVKEYNNLALTYVGGVMFYYKKTQDQYLLDKLSYLKNPILDHYLKTRTMEGERDE